MSFRDFQQLLKISLKAGVVAEILDMHELQY
jgi:hypothetical protein